MEILFLGKYDESMHSLEEKILNIQETSSSNNEFKYNESSKADVINYPFKNCNIWVISGDVKPTLLLKQLISETKILLLIFNLSKLETLDFLTKGWGPIIKKKEKSEDQKRILIGTNSNLNSYSTDIIQKIKDTMNDLDCKEYSVDKINTNPDKIGNYPVIPDILDYIEKIIFPKKNDQNKIPKEEGPKCPTKSEHEENDKNISKTNKDDKCNKKVENISENENEPKIECKIGNFIFNLFPKSKTAEIVSIKNGPEIIIPDTIPYQQEHYIITNICDYALEGSTIRELFLPAYLEKLSKYWCANAENLSIIDVNEYNRYFKIKKGFLIHDEGSTPEILFALLNFTGTYFADYSIGSYAFYKRSGFRELAIEGESQPITIGDFSFSNALNLQSIKIICKNGFQIGKNCFENCCCLSVISIQNESEDDLVISMNAFQNCKSLVEINICNKSRLILEDEVFLNNEKLENVTLTGRDVIIGERCFKNSFNKYYILYKIIIKSESIVEIGKNCFEESFIGNAEITGTEVKIKSESFTKCSHLKNFTIYESEKVFIEDFSFKECTYLEKISLNKIGFISINPNAFFGCKINNFKLTFGKIFNSQNYYEIKKILQTGNSSNLYLLQKKNTDDLFVARQLFQVNKYQYSDIFAKQVILLSKDFDSINTKLCGFGTIKFDDKSKEYLTIITKYYINGSLKDVFNNNKSLSEIQKYIIILGITFDMRFLYANRFSYPNLSPEKILLDENYYPHLNILGYSHKEEPTIYTAPYSFDKEKKDIYSYSLIIYELITGQQPYNKHASIYTIISDAQKGNRPDIYFIKNTYLQDFLQKCWNKTYLKSFNEIFNEITTEKFISIFKGNKENIYNYMRMLRIPEFTEEIIIKNIRYTLFKWSEIAKIKKVNITNNNFEFQSSIEHESKKYVVNEICNDAFRFSSLTCLNINTNQNITFQTDAFNNCYSLSTVNIKSSKSLIISNNCFSNSNIESFEAIGDFVEIGENCFSSLIYLQSLKIVSKKIKFYDNCFKDCKSLSSFSIINESEDDLIFLMNSFQNCVSLTNITIQNKSKIILESKLFSEKNILQKIYISGNQIFIENECFYKSFNKYTNAGNSIKLESKELIVIGKQSFKESYIGIVEILGAEIHIEEESFKNCSALINIIVTSSEEVMIQKYAFKNCINLQSILIKEIGYLKIECDALFGCNKLNIIDVNLTKPFKSSKYYQSVKKYKRNSNIIHRYQKNGTDENYIAKVFYTNIPKGYLGYLLSQLIILSKENNPTMTNSLECGLFIFSQKPRFSIVSNYFVNGSLDTKIANKLDGTQKYIILLGIALGMQYIHSKNIIHQILTPKKILLDESYYPHLNNFGFSRSPTDYDAPEVIEGKTNDIKSDVYSFALIVYQLITGEISLTSIVLNTLKNEKLQILLQRCLSSDPFKRPTFSEIIDNITNAQYLNYFGANEEKIYEYLNLFGKIELYEEIIVNEIQYYIYERSKTAKIIKIYGKNTQFRNPIYLHYNNKLYTIT